MQSLVGGKSICDAEGRGHRDWSDPAAPCDHSIARTEVLAAAGLSPVHSAVGHVQDVRRGAELGIRDRKLCETAGSVEYAIHRSRRGNDVETLRAAITAALPI